jgi:hypothetical protein
MTSYTEEEMLQIMRELHIAPQDGKLTGSEAAKVLTWRAEHEFQVQYQYDAGALRQHVRAGSLQREELDKNHSRRTLYPYQLIFQLPISPRRGASRRNRSQSESE